MVRGVQFYEQLWIAFAWSFPENNLPPSFLRSLLQTQQEWCILFLIIFFNLKKLIISLGNVFPS